jgi:hypothetical protein
MYMTLSTFSEKVRRHKALTIIAAIGGLFVFLVILAAIAAVFSMVTYTTPSSDVMMLSEQASSPYIGIPAPDLGQETDLTIHEGQATIKSDAAEQDASALREMAERHDGYIEEGAKRETTTRISVTSTVRVPVDNFDALVRDIMDRFDIEDHEIRNIRVGIQRELDEMEIIKRTFEEYGRIREEIQNLPIGEEKISLLMEITEQELELASRKKQYERQLGGKERQADLATLSITFNQKVKARIWPEDLGNEFRDRVHTGVEEISKAAMNTVVYSIVLLAWVAQFLVYAIIIVVPIILVTRIGVRIYRRATRR